MIISREYVSFQRLINTDPDAKAIILNAFEKSYSFMDKQRYEEWYFTFTRQCLYQRDMGWCLQGIGDVIEGFKQLDEENPYDNGFTYEDVNRVDILSKSPEGMTLALMNVIDGIEQFVAIVHTGKGETLTDEAAAYIMAEAFRHYKKEDNLEHWRNFPETMWELGFEMDCGQSFREYQATCGLTVKPATNEREEKRNTLYLLEHADRQIIGNYLFSHWRYLTHWSFGYSEHEVGFMRRIMALLESKYAESGESEG